MNNENTTAVNEKKDPLEEEIEKMEELEREDGLGNGEVGVTDTIHEVE